MSAAFVMEIQCTDKITDEQASKSARKQQHLIIHFKYDRYFI